MAIAPARGRRCSEVYELPLPAVVAVKEGINLPRYPSVPGRLRARKAPLDVRHARRASVAGPTKVRLVVPRARGDDGRGAGRAAPDAAPRVVEVLQQLGLVRSMILVLVEHADGRPDRAVARGARRRAAAGGRTERGPIEAVLVGEGAGAAPAGSAPQGVATAHVGRASRRSTTTRRRPGRRRFPQVMGRARAAAVVASGTDRGNEVLAHVGARTGLPLAANCLAVEPGAPVDPSA